MDIKRFNKIISGLKKQGIKIIRDEEMDRYLKARGAEAMTSNDGEFIYFQQGATPAASAVFEELIHCSQIRKYGQIEYINADGNKEYLKREIEAQEKMLRNAKAYGFTKNDISNIENNLQKYKKAWEEKGYGK